MNINRAKSPKRKRNDHDGINEKKEGENEASNKYSPSSPSILCTSFGNDESSPIFGFDNDFFDIDNEASKNYSPSSPSILCPSFGSPIFGFDNDCVDIDNEALNIYSPSSPSILCPSFGLVLIMIVLISKTCEH